MSQLKNIAIGIATAPELFGALVVLLAFVYYPSLFTTAGTKLVEDSESWKYLIYLPSAFTVLSFNAAKSLRSPGDKELNKVLYEWPLYHLLIGRINLALTVSTICAATVIIIWLFGKDLDPSLIGATFIATCVTSGIVTIGLIFASWKLPEILTKHSS